MIEKLTEEQEALMIQTRDEWIDLFFNNVKEQKGIDKEKFEKGISWLYTDLLGKPMPKIVYCDNLGSCLTDIDNFESKGKSQKYAFDGAIDLATEPYLRTVRFSIDPFVWEIVRENIFIPSISDFIFTPILYAVKAYTKPNYSSRIWSYAWDWGIFYDFFEKIGVVQGDKLTRYKELIKSGVFVTCPYEDIVFAVQPPIAIERDDQGKLHSIEKEAVLFKDGTKYFFIHGVPFSEEEFKMQSKSIDK